MDVHGPADGAAAQSQANINLLAGEPSTHTKEAALEYHNRSQQALKWGSDLS